jgi:hypothetical protein
MNNQTLTNFDMEPFFLDGSPIEKIDSVIIQDAQRATPLLFGTLMAQIAASKKYTPFINEAAVDGTAYPCGIYLGADILAADLVAGDATGCIIAVRGNPISFYTTSGLTIENNKTLDTVIGAATIHAKTVRQHLLELGFKFEGTVSIDKYENT